MKHTTTLLLLFVCFALPFTTRAQGWQWENHIVNNPFAVSSRQTGLAVDTSGNVFSAITLGGFSTLLGGVTSTFGTKSIVDSTDAGQTILTKTAPDGNVLWAIGTQHTGTGVTNITTDKTGNSYILGVYDSAGCTFGNYPLAHAPLPGLSNTMYFMAKISPAGNVVWAKNVVPTNCFGIGVGLSVNNYFPHGNIRADDSGHLYVTGTFSEPTITIGSTLLAVSGQQSMFIAKYDTAGTPLWAKTYGSTGTDYIFNTGLTKTGELYMVGSYYAPSINFGTITLSNTSNKGAFLAKFDNGGNPLWARTTDTFAYIWDLAVDSAADVYICGSFNTDSIHFNSHVLTNTNTDHSDGFLVKYNSAGTVVWARSMGGDSSDIAEKVAVDNCGNVFITGSTSYLYSTPGGYDLYFNGNTHTLDIDGPFSYPLFIARYSEGGQYLNCFGRHGSGANQPRIVTDNKGSFYVSSQWTNSIDTFGTDVLMADSQEYYQFLAKFDYDSVGCTPYAALPVHNISAPMQNVSLFPNPATTEFSLHSDIEFPAGSSLTVFDMAGKQVNFTALNGNNTTISTVNLSPGIYQCVINMQASGSIFKKVVVLP